MSEKSGALELKKGLHRIGLSYFNSGGPLGLNVSLKLGAGAKEPLGGNHLLHQAGGGATSQPSTTAAQGNP